MSDRKRSRSMELYERVVEPALAELSRLTGEEHPSVLRRELLELMGDRARLIMKWACENDKELQCVYEIRPWRNQYETLKAEFKVPEREGSDQAVAEARARRTANHLISALLEA